jgi:hypothetical protein
MSPDKSVNLTENALSFEAPAPSFEWIVRDTYGSQESHEPTANPLVRVARIPTGARSDASGWGLGSQYRFGQHCATREDLSAEAPRRENSWLITEWKGCSQQESTGPATHHVGACELATASLGN